jgi:hypothetical protein
MGLDILKAQKGMSMIVRKSKDCIVYVHVYNDKYICSAEIIQCSRPLQSNNRIYKAMKDDNYL